MSLTAAFSRPDADTAAGHTPPTAPILVVDDNAAKRLAMRAVLAPLGHLVVEADSGAAALRCLLTNNFAVILLDVRMPIMDGFETAALIRLRRQSEMTPIMFITAYQADETVTNLYCEGVADFMTAPVDPDVLRAKVSVFANLFLQAQANAMKARELQSSADQLRLLTETAPVGIFQIDAQNRYVYTNARWTEITGVSSEAAVGAEWHIILDPERRAEVALDFGSAVPGEELSSRLRISTRTGSPARLAVLTARPVAVEGRPSGWVGTLADITAEGDAEAVLVEARDRATEVSRLKSDFIANMSHEIRTPMSGVIGWTELLLDTDLDAEQRTVVNTMSRAGQALMNVINSILDFSKIETGKLDLENIEFSVQEVVDGVVEVLSGVADAKGLELTSAVDPIVPATMMGDPHRVRQVLTNLVGNAIKFTDTGHIAIRVNLDMAGGSDDNVRFEVTDAGIGIAADKLAMIFEDFSQADTSVTREYGGTGLGLAICSRLTSLMGGQVGVTSELGVGSTFWFTVRVHTLADESTPDTASTHADFRASAP